LMIGGDLTVADDWTRSLLTNPEVLAVDQHSIHNHLVIKTDQAMVWLADSAASDGQYLALFNIGESEATLHYEWRDFGLQEKTYKLRDLWIRKDLAPGDSMSVTVPAHGSVLYRLSQQ
jgi:alpha-galactosidase